MGTQGGLSHSDPDYTSSSEQSCDTVIYLPNHPYPHAISDQELTDNERPPSSVPVPRNIPHKIQPRTVPTFSRSKSHSGDESGSDGDRSTVVSNHSSQGGGSSSRGEYPVSPRFYGATVNCDHNNKMQMFQQQQHQCPSGRVMPRMIPEPRMVPLSVSKPRIGPSPLTFQHNSLHDPSMYGPAPLPGYYHTHGPEQNTQTGSCDEQWIDGPMMSPASAISNNNPKSSGSRQRPHHWMNRPSSNSRTSEQWIDGPKEFVVEVEQSTEESNCKPSLLPKPSTPSRIPSSLSKVISTKDHKSHRHYDKKSELPQASRVLPSNSDSEVTSHHKNLQSICDKHSVKVHSNNNNKTVGCSSTSCGTQVPVKSFVKDWVERHSGMTSSDTGTEDESRQHKSRGKSRKDKQKLLQNNNAQVSLNTMLYGKDSSVVKRNSPHSSPKSSPHLNKRKEVSNAPSEGAATSSQGSERTIAWVHSVQTDNDFIDRHSSDTQTANNAKQTVENVSDDTIHQTDKSEHNYMSIKSLQHCAPPPTADYEKLVFTSKLEDVEEVEEECTTEPEEVQDIEKVNETLPGTKVNVEILDSSFESESEKNETNLFMTNRESIYELQFDAELETSRGSLRNSFHSEDDAWSLGSIPKDSEHNITEIETKDVDNVEVPSLDSIYANQTLESCNTFNNINTSTLDSGNGTQLDNSFATTVESSKVMPNDLDTSTGISTMDSKKENTTDSSIVLASDNGELSPLIVDASNHDLVVKEGISSFNESSVASVSKLPPSFLRRPDGASNPNLSAICETPKSSILSSPGQETAYFMSSGATSPITPPYLRSNSHDYATIGERSVVGQSPDGSEEFYALSDTTVSHKESKSHFWSKSKSSELSKNCSKDSPAKSTEKPQVPPRGSSKLSSPSKEYSRSSSLKDQSRIVMKNSESSQTSMFGRSISAPAVKTSSSKSKEKHKSSSSPSPSAKPSPIRFPKNSFSSRLPLCNGKKGKEAQLSPTKSSASSGKESKSSKDSKGTLKDSNKSTSSRESKSSTKDSRSSSKEMKSSKEGKSSKDAKSSWSYKSNKDNKQNSYSSRSKSPSSFSKKDSESKLPLGRTGLRVSSTSSRSKGCESDSGIESGRLKSDLFFPSSRQQRPRISMHSTSSGHGSDVSSTFSGPITTSSKHGTPKESRTDVCNSSGYESMLRDSEITATSSSHDSTSESGHSDRSSSNIPKRRSFCKY